MLGVQIYLDLLLIFYDSLIDLLLFHLYKKVKILQKVDDCGKIIGYEIAKDPEFGEDEIAWNICYNEILDKFQTFYSWIPIASANIDNQFYSFDR